MYSNLAAVLIFFLLVACKQESSIISGMAKPDFIFENLDTTISPAKDFFQYANNGWIKKNPIPADQSSWGIGNLVLEENIKRLRQISEVAAAKNSASPGTPDQMIGDFWASGMDSAKIEKDRLTYLKPYLNQIDKIKDIPSMMELVASFKKIGSSTFFSDFVNQDDKNSEMMTYTFYQGGTGLPEREYYFKNDSATINIRNQYISYIGKILHIAGKDSVASIQSGQQILAFETKLAKASRKIEDLRDPYANYNKMAIRDLKKMSPFIDLQNYLKNAGVSHLDSVIVGQPEFYTSMNQITKATPLDLLKDYLRFNLVSDFAGALPDPFGIA
ncbi:MAG: M13 family metallopeptidase N-terminal domain-containing protein, partial [Saprospiraceae bacterium]